MIIAIVFTAKGFKLIPMDTVEAVLLTGGASRRMGTDKAKLIVDGEPLAARIARLLGEAGVSVTVLGREPLAGHGFVMDEEEFGGPLRSLADFTPSAPFVFVVSCDLPGFDASIAGALSSQIDGYDAAVPELDGRLQPLCALYRVSAFASIPALVESGERRMMRWLDSLSVNVVADVKPDWIRNVNTPGDLG